MASLKELGDTITNELKNGEHLRDLIHILEAYTGIDWQQYVKFDNEKYVRNNVYSNEYIDILIICWGNNQSSRVHDHPEKGCLMKILDGTLQEDLYVKRETSYLFIKSNTLEKDSIAYKESTNCVHDIIAINNRAVSLHIYSPSGYKPNYY